MPLPKIDLPVFEDVVPSTGRKCLYRPFTVKEEKILLSAQESDDFKQMMLAIKQILNNCLTYVNVDEIALFDATYLMLKIRSQSVSNISTFKFKDNETDEVIEIDVDINDIYVKSKEGHTKEIYLDENNTLVMRYPTINEVLSISDENEKEDSFHIMIDCMDYVISGDDEVIKMSDVSDKEVEEFLDGLSSETFEKLKNFYYTMPDIRYDVEYMNSKGSKRKFHLEGIRTFFS